MPAPTVTVVVLAYGREPWLRECIEAIHESKDVRIRLVVVDNGCSNPYLNSITSLRNTVVLRPATNLGFARGVNYGASGAESEFLAMVNSDAIVEPDALGALARSLGDVEVGVVSACVVFADRPELVNSIGNPVHVLGFSWAGGIGSPRTEHTVSKPIASITGACAMLTTTWWNQLGGFSPEYFAYYEDVDLSWRTWQRGRSARFVPDAIVRHHYDNQRTGSKNYLLERNRLIFVLTTYERRTLILLAPLLVCAELGVAVLAGRRGWLGGKARGWLWLVSHRGWLRRRRRELQAVRTRDDRELACVWSTDFDGNHESTPAASVLLNRAVKAYWRHVVIGH